MLHVFKACQIKLPAYAAVLVMMVITLCPNLPVYSQTSSEITNYEPRLRGGDEAFSAFMLGVFLMDRGADQAAVKYLENSWQKSGYNTLIGVKLAEAYFRQGRVSSCSKIVDEILGRENSNHDALLLKGKVLYLEGNTGGASNMLEKAARVGPASFEVQRLLGKIYYEQGAYLKALKAYDNAVILEGNYPYMHFRRGLLLERFKRIADAEIAFSKALALNPAFSEAAVELASVFIRTARHARADSLLKGVIARDQDNQQALIKLCSMYLEDGRYDDGIKLLEQRVRSVSLSKEGRILLGRFYYEAKEFNEALSVFEKVFLEEESSQELARILGEINLRTGRRDEALSYYKRAIEIDPQDYRSYLSLFFASSPKFAGNEAAPIKLDEKEALGLISKAARSVKEGDYEGFYLVGVAYQGVDSLEAAGKMLYEAFKAKSDDPRILLALAGVEEKNRHFTKAKKYLNALYEMKPDDPDINNFYGYLLAESGGNLEKAESMVKKAMAADPANGYYMDSLGWVYYMRGDYDKALIELEKATEIIKNDPIMLEHLGDAYRALKRYRKALAAYEQSKKLQGLNTELLQKIESAKKGAN